MDVVGWWLLPVTWWQHLVGYAVWAVILGGGLLVIRLIARFVYRRPVTKPFQLVLGKWHRWLPGSFEIYRTCSDCGGPSRMAVNPDDFVDLLAGDLPPSRCGPCRTAWLKTTWRVTHPA